MFQSRSNKRVVCEDCYWAHLYGHKDYTKMFKRCVLPEVITPEISRALCHCRDVPHHDGSGKPLALFPMIDQDKAKHIDVGGSGTIQCGLLKLGELVTRAKYNALEISGNMNEAENETKSLGKREKERKRESREPVLRSTTTDALTDPDIPPFLRKSAGKYPFGDVHMALRVGPLVIENGVSQ